MDILTDFQKQILKAISGITMLMHKIELTGE
jgi:hypothetical protein